MSDPFAKLAPSTVDSLRALTVYAASWLGDARVYSIQAIQHLWESSPKLRRWLAKYANTRVRPLYYGRHIEAESQLPTLGSVYRRRGGILHWSSDRQVSRGFAALTHEFHEPDAGTYGGGFLIEATKVPNGQVILDFCGLARVCGKHPASFGRVQPRTDVRDLFLHPAACLEHEVLTTGRVMGRVVEARMFRPQRENAGRSKTLRRPTRANGNRNEMRLRRGEVIYHGTRSSRPFNSVQWMSLVRDMARHLIAYNDGSGDPRILELKAARSLRLIRFHDMFDYNRFGRKHLGLPSYADADERGIRYDIDEMADAICRLGYDGWGWYLKVEVDKDSDEDGFCVMLCDPGSVLQHVRTEAP